MNVTHEITKLERSAVKLSLTISQADVAASYSELVKKFAKNAQIPGFRKGHAPVSVLERKYGADLKNEAMVELADDAFKEVVEKIDEKPLYYSTPQLEGNLDFDLTKDFTFAFTYDVMPKPAAPDLSGISITEPQVNITDGDVQKELEVIQKRNAVILDRKPEEPAQKGDIVTVSWRELDGEGNAVEGSGQEGFVLTAGDETGKFSLGEDVVGLKSGDAKEVVKTFPADYRDAAVAGKTVKFSLKVSNVQREDIPAIDDDLAQDVSEKFKTLADLKADVVKRLEGIKSSRLEAQNQRAVLDALVAQNPFELPESMVRAEIESKKQSMIAQSGMKEADLIKMFGGPEKFESLFAERREESEKLLKGQILLQTLLAAKDIKVSEEEAEAELQKYAENLGANAEEMKSYYKPGTQAYEYFISDIKQKKLFADIFSHIKITKGKEITLEEFLNHEQEHD